MNKNPHSSLRLTGVVLSTVILVTFLASCAKQDIGTPAVNTTQIDPVIKTIPKSPGQMNIPADNPMTEANIDLGRHLFFDTKLSVDGRSVACASCHQVSNGFADVLSTSIGMNGQHGTRNAPALANVGYNSFFTWDGRFPSLEKHAPGPIFNSVEMGNNFSTTGQDSIPSGYNSSPGPNDSNTLFKRLLDGTPSKENKTYDQLFQAAWGSSEIGVNGLSLDHIAKSIAAFERTIVSTQSTFDAYNNGDQSVYQNGPQAAQALHGMQLFMDTKGANCISCHSGYNFTDQKFHDNGIGTNPGGDQGRFNITKDPNDIGKFKTPSLRNVALSAPYMHDGSFKTLEQVIQNYNMGGTKPTENTDPQISGRPLNLKASDVADIVEFLKTLTDYNFAANNSRKFTNPWK
jgi:cytochrome c peroxidase